MKIDNFTFAPQRVTVKPGTTVTWINEDDIPHAIAATGKEFRSKVLDTDDKFSFTFTTAGTFEYFCSLHPHMTGTIVVEAATGGRCGPVMQGLRRRSPRGAGPQPGAFSGRGNPISGSRMRQCKMSERFSSLIM